MAPRSVSSRSASVRPVPGVIAAAGIALTLLLTACGPGALDPDTSSAPPSESETATPEPTEPSTTPTPTPSADDELPDPVAEGCDEIFTLDQLYAFNPNFAALGDSNASPSFLHEQARALQGVTCAFENTTSGEQLVISVSHLNDEDLSTEIRDRASDGPVYVSADGGTVELASGDWWIVVSSPYFGSAADAEPVLSDVEANLGA